MNKFVFFVLLAAIAANALTLEQVRSGLKESFIASDSVEIGVKTTVSSSVMSSPQTVTVFLVRKGPNEVLFRNKNAFDESENNCQ